MFANHDICHEHIKSVNVTAYQSNDAEWYYNIITCVREVSEQVADETM